MTTAGETDADETDPGETDADETDPGETDAVERALDVAFPDRTVETYGDAGLSWNDGNRTVAVDFIDGDRVYLKVAVDGDGSRAAREAAVITLVSERTSLELPELVAAAPADDPAYVATADVGGTPGWKAWQDAGDEQRTAIARALGRALAELHAVRFDEHGHIDALGTAPDSQAGSGEASTETLPVDTAPWTEVLVDTIEETREQADGCRFDHHFDDVLALVRDNRTTLDDAPAALLHGDPARPNAVVLEPPEGAPSPGAPSSGASSPGAPSSGASSPGAPSSGASSPGAPSPGAPSPGAPSPGASSPRAQPGKTGERTGPGMVSVGLLDWELAHVGDPVRELQRAKRQFVLSQYDPGTDRHVDAFYDGYRATAGGLPAGYADRYRIYDAVTYLGVSGFFEKWAPDVDEPIEDIATDVREEMARRLDAARD